MRRSDALLLLICLAQFMVVLDISIVNVALPALRADLGFSTTGLQWVLNAYTVTFAGLLMLGGRASDLLGRRRMFLVGTALFAISSLLCAAAQSRGLLIGARAVQGMGAAVISPVTLAILTASFAEGAERNRALGVWGAMSGLGASAGALLGGVFTDALGWQAIFFVNVPIGAFAVAAGRRLIDRDTPAATRSFDVTGALLITAGLGAIVYGIVRTTQLGWGAAGTVGPITAGVAALGLFVWVEHRVASAPIIPLHIFRRPQLRAANLVVALLYGAMFPMFFFVTLFLQQVEGYSPLSAGLAFLPMTLGVFAASSLAPRLLARVGVRRTLVAGMVSAAAGLVWFTTLHPDATYVGGVLPGALLSAAGLGLALVSATIVAVQGVPAQESGLASGIVNSSRLMGGALGLAVLTTIAASRTDGALAVSTTALQATTDGYGIAFTIGAALCVAGAAVAARVIREPAPRVAAATEPA